MILKILNTRHTKSWETKAEGAIRAKQIHTPIAQKMLTSREDFLLMMRVISGIFQKGRIIAATRAILWII